MGKCIISVFYWLWASVEVECLIPVLEVMSSVGMIE